MNRKERRAARRSGRDLPVRSAADRKDAAGELFSTAVAYHQAGMLADAERFYRQILAIAPGRFDVHSRLGAVIMGQGKIKEAIPHLERALALKPDLFEAHGNLAQAYTWTGQRDRAIEAAARALELRETPHSKAMFAQCVVFARFTADSPRFRRLLLRALSEAWIRPRDLSFACISLIKLNGAINDCIGRADAAWPALLPPAAAFSAAELSAMARDELLCRLLECEPVTDIGLERLLTNVRRAMLTASSAADVPDDTVLGFYAAVARQCFINEYVFATTATEAAEAQRLRTSLEQALAAGGEYPALWPIAVGAYFPLHAVANAERLLDRSWPQSVDALLVQQIKEPAEERRIAPTIPGLTSIDDDVSRAVREQYEENPYPRWTKAGPPAQTPIAVQGRPGQVIDILVAGCGTGLSTIELARDARDARILAIDLSVASLCYAKRMAQQFGLANVEFAQADIMKLTSLGRQFDLIDASGVLHHLADPWQGWQILLALLRPGAVMQVGLYSEQARRNIVAARALIAERGYRPVADDIRRCRQDIMASADPLLKSTVNAPDFFATSGCRDLLFHVQEHRTTLPEIKSFLAARHLEFAGFFLDALTHYRFATRFPQARALTDLDCWQVFEAEAPGTFAAMYQFSVRKPAARAHAAAPHSP